MKYKMSDRQRILLLRSEQQTEKDAFISELRLHKHEVDDVPVMTFTFPHQDHLHSLLLQPSLFSGIILTSPRAVRAIHLLQGAEKLLRVWKDKVTYVVGEATHTAATNLGLQTRGKESGNASNLSDVIINDFQTNTTTLPLLFLCTSKKLSVLPSKLNQGGVPFECCHVYESHQSQTLHSQLSQSLTKPVDFILFFSPSCLKSCAPTIRHLKPTCKFLALGRSTAEAMASEGLRVHATLQTPHPQSLLDLLSHNHPPSTYQIPSMEQLPSDHRPT